MTVKKNKVTVEIYGESYAVKGDAEIEQIERVAALIDERMRRTARSNPRLSTTKIAVLTALNIADEFLRLEQDYRQLVQMLKEGK
ncbi:MAG TPA: cell division protein ZapA [Selenomonadales bacterium]|nr:cell division protein ZapA [Selenomonadales bacterium]